MSYSGTLYSSWPLAPDPFVRVQESIYGLSIKDSWTLTNGSGASGPTTKSCKYSHVLIIEAIYTPGPVTDGS